MGLRQLLKSHGGYPIPPTERVLLRKGITVANFKKGKTKRRVKCTLCTKYRWLGNNKGRKRVSELKAIASSQAQDEDRYQRGE